jgi:hypothetical protein
VRLVTVGKLGSIVEATREFKSALGVDGWVETIRNVPREAGLGLAKKVSKLALSTRNIKEKLEFAKIYKD